MSGISGTGTNLKTISTSKLSNHIDASIAMGGNIAVFGRRGSGKTEISKQRIQNSGCIEVYMNLSVMERPDLGGYPNFGHSKGDGDFLSFLLPQFYKLMITGDTKVVALLDEVDKADPSLWAPLLEFTQFKSINGQKFKNLKSVIMTGNLISEGGAKPSPPLLDRTEKYIVEPDFKGWKTWAKGAGVHDSVIEYLTNHPSHLFGATDPGERYADPSPRGWNQVSNILKTGESLNWDIDMVSEKVSGSVGLTHGEKFAEYYEHYHGLNPLISGVFSGASAKILVKKYNDLPVTKRVSVAIMVCQRMASEIDDSAKNLSDTFDNVGNFLNEIDMENAFVAINKYLTRSRLAKCDAPNNAIWRKLLMKLKSSGKTR